MSIHRRLEGKDLDESGEVEVDDDLDGATEEADEEGQDSRENSTNDGEDGTNQAREHFAVLFISYILPNGQGDSPNDDKGNLESDLGVNADDGEDVRERSQDQLRGPRQTRKQSHGTKVPTVRVAERRAKTLPSPIAPAGRALIAVTATSTVALMSRMMPLTVS